MAQEQCVKKSLSIQSQRRVLHRGWDGNTEQTQDRWRDLQMRDDLARIASSLTVGLDHKKWNGSLLGRGAAMSAIGIDAMIASYEGRISALAPFHQKRREF